MEVDPVVMAGLIFALLIAASIAPVSANHEVIVARWQEGLYVHGNQFRTYVNITTNDSEIRHSQGSSTETSYFVVVKDEIVSVPGIPIQEYNMTILVAPNSTDEREFKRPFDRGLLGS